MTAEKNREEKDILSDSEKLFSDSPLAAELMRDKERLKEVMKTPFKVPSEPRIITVANQKGGVGKTTSAVNIAAALAKGGLSLSLIHI